MPRSPVADIRRFYEAGGYVKPKAKTDPLLSIRQALYGSQFYAGGGQVKSLIKRIGEKYGAQQGQRVERAADSTNLERFSDKSLQGMFEPDAFGVNKGLYTMMPTNRFEGLAVPITPEAMARDPYRRWETQAPAAARKEWGRKTGGLDFDNYVDNIAGLIEKRGLTEAPTLWMGRQGRMPNIAKRPVADAHFTRFLGYPDVRTANQTSGLRKELSNPEYGDILPWWRKRVADPLGIDDRDAQALMWNIGGPQTGVSYIGAPKLEMISNYIDQSAKRLDIPLEEAAYKLLSGASPGYAGGGQVSQLIKRVAHAYGAKQAQRAERAADSVDLSRYNDDALRDVFDSRNRGLLTTLRPSEFEKYASPLPKAWTEEVPYRGSGAGYMDWGGDYKSYIDGLKNVATKGGGFDETPALWFQKTPHPIFSERKMPWVSAHDGRHRMRALAELDDDFALVNLMPEQYGALGRQSGNARITPNFFGRMREVLPQKYRMDDPTTWQAQQLPNEVFARGGRVKRDMELYHTSQWQEPWS